MQRTDPAWMKTFYEGTPADKLATASTLLTDLAGADGPVLALEIETLRRHVAALDDHMRAMDLGRLCTACAARPDGGCCSALMADNTDAIQILINLLVGVEVARQADDGGQCCFLGPRGCVFLVKPIFCLNYNCTHILAQSQPERLDTLYRLTGAVLSQQTRIEFLLLDWLRARTKERNKR